MGKFKAHISCGVTAQLISAFVLVLMDIYGKTLKILLFKDQVSYDLETLHEARKWLTLTYFTTRSNLDTYVFEWRKLLHSHLICRK